MSGVTGIVFSRNRAAQLDLLLSSIQTHAPSLFERIVVIWRATDERFLAAYRVLQDEHPEALCLAEQDFAKQVRAEVERAGRFVSFLCDDDIVWRWWSEACAPGQYLAAHKDVLCVSLRLGANTTRCYPLNDRPQASPGRVWRGGMYVWPWQKATCDLSYPGSLDGHVFRRSHLSLLLRNGTWDSPNSLEGHLAEQVKGCTVPFMASYKRSLLFGNPLNRVQDTHPNRHAPHGSSVKDLNDAYLAGLRIRVEDLRIPVPPAAHMELELSPVSV